MPCASAPIVRLVSVLPVLLGLLASTAPARAADRPPNVVLIMADDLGIGELGVHGQRFIRTPSVDRLAREGMRFTQHYSGAPVCAPSRCVLLTGRDSGHAIVRDNRERGGWGPDEPEGQHPLPAGTPTLGTLLQQAGYATAAIGKWGLGGPGTSGEPNDHGFDLFYGYLCQRVAHNLYPTHLWRDDRREPLEGNVWGNRVGTLYAHDLMIDEAIRFIDEHRDEPFLLYLPLHLPHLALQVPEEDVEPYLGTFEDPPYEGGKGYLPHPTPRAAYAGMVTRLDRGVGMVVDHLDALGLGDDTLVLFTSDNGPTHDVGGADSDFFESTAGRRGRKGSVWEGGIRVPLVARWPGRIPANVESDLASAHWDLLATICDAAGVEVTVPTEGISLLPTLEGRADAQPAHAHLYWEFPGYGGQQAVRLGKWKGVKRHLRRGEDRLRLFDLEADPAETTDVVAEHPEVAARIEAIMRTAREPSAVFPLPGVDVPAPAPRR